MLRVAGKVDLSILLFAMCGSRNYPYYPHGRSLSLEIPRGRGELKAKLLEGQYEAKLEFPGGCGSAKHGGSMDIFWNYTILQDTSLHVKYILQVVSQRSNYFCPASCRKNCLVCQHLMCRYKRQVNQGSEGMGEAQGGTRSIHDGGVRRIFLG